MKLLSQFSGAILALTMVVTSSAIEPPVAFDRVEEDWVAYVANPDEVIIAPQIINVISPRQDTTGAFGMIELNHGSRPQFEGGGYQVQGWVGDLNHEFKWSSTSGRLRHDFDKLQYTVSMEKTGDKVRFGLKNGRSRTWGRFAKEGLYAEATYPLIDFSAYTPEFSVASTTVNVGAHRVALMYQRETRYYQGDQLVRKDSTPRILHRYRSVVEFVSLEEYEQKEEYFNIDITE